MDTAPGTTIAAGVPTGLAGPMAITLVLNGTPVKLDVAAWTTLGVERSFARCSMRLE